MSSNYIKNLVGFNLSEDQMQHVTHPGGELWTHIAFKFLQTGAILGFCFIAPTIQCFKGPRTFPDMAAAALRGGAIGSAVGLAVGPVLAY